MLKVGGTSWENMGSMNWELVGFLALGWIIVGTFISKGIKSSGKTVYFTAIFPYVVMTILFIRGKRHKFYFTQNKFINHINLHKYKNKQL